MTNTIENKAKFFANYFGQKVGRYKPEFENHFISLKHSVSDDEYLELTPLSQISDEDALQVSKILDANFDENTLSDSARIFHINRGKGHVLPSRPCRSDVCDYLRSKGYAMPYMGLSVEKLVEYNWIKLKTE